MPRWSLRRPDCTEIAETLGQVVSITALARHYGITFTTARKWIRTCGLEDSTKSQKNLAKLKELTTEGPRAARRARIDKDLDFTLGDIGDRKLLARAIVDEFAMRYVSKRCFDWKRYVLKLIIVMYDYPPVEEISHLVGVPLRTRFRKAKSGVRVPCWYVVIEGYRAFRVLQLTRPYLTGQKAFQADIALKSGAISLVWIPLQKDVYKRQMLGAFGYNTDYWQS